MIHSNKPNVKICTLQMFQNVSRSCLDRKWAKAVVEPTGTRQLFCVYMVLEMRRIRLTFNALPAWQSLMDGVWQSGRIGVSTLRRVVICTWLSNTFRSMLLMHPLWPLHGLLVSQLLVVVVFDVCSAQLCSAFSVNALLCLLLLRGWFLPREILRAVLILLSRTYSTKCSSQSYKGAE
jgi:hypothetical protein